MNYFFSLINVLSGLPAMSAFAMVLTVNLVLGEILQLRFVLSAELPLAHQKPRVVVGPLLDRLFLLHVKFWLVMTYLVTLKVISVGVHVLPACCWGSFCMPPFVVVSMCCWSGESQSHRMLVESSNRYHLLPRTPVRVLVLHYLIFTA